MLLVVTLQEFIEGPFSQSNLDPGANLIIAVPGPQGGVVVLGQSVITYIRKKRSADDQAVKSIQIQATLVKVCQQQTSIAFMNSMSLIFLCSVKASLSDVAKASLSAVAMLFAMAHVEHAPILLEALTQS